MLKTQLIYYLFLADLNREKASSNEKAIADIPNPMPKSKKTPW